MKCTNFVFDYVDLFLYNNSTKINLNHDGSYIVSPDWIKSETATIKPEKNDDKCFQYACIRYLESQNIFKKLNNCF